MTMTDNDTDDGAPDGDPPPGDFDYGERREDGQYENHPTIDEGEVEDDWVVDG